MAGAGRRTTKKSMLLAAVLACESPLVARNVHKTWDVFLIFLPWIAICEVQQGKIMITNLSSFANSEETSATVAMPVFFQEPLCLFLGRLTVSPLRPIWRGTSVHLSNFFV